MVTADESDLSNDDPLNEEDILYLDAASPVNDDKVIATIADAGAECNEDTFILPLDHIFC